jgi:dihydrodipicolinate synthase/N-acetylneuraminate lyase
VIDLAGILPMAVTPFAADGSVAASDLRRIVSFCLEAGCPGIATLGLGGEVGALDARERRDIAEIVVAAADGRPVVIGCSADDTATSIELARHAAETGASCVMVAPPRRPDWSRGRLLEHYAAVAGAVDPLPVMVQDAPQFVGVALDRDFVRELRAACSNVGYAKPEATPAADRTAELVELGDVAVFGGHGGLYMLDVLEAGAAGMIPGCDSPELHVAIFEHHRAGRPDDARRLFARVLPLLVTAFQSLDYFIAASKTILVERGVIARGELRGPMPISSLGLGLLLEAARHAGALDRRPAL